MAYPHLWEDLKFAALVSTIAVLVFHLGYFGYYNITHDNICHVTYKNLSIDVQGSSLRSFKDSYKSYIEKQSGLDQIVLNDDIKNLTLGNCTFFPNAIAAQAFLINFDQNKIVFTKPS